VLALELYKVSKACRRATSPYPITPPGVRRYRESLAWFYVISLFRAAATAARGVTALPKKTTGHKDFLHAGEASE
jgi:hypothetical protein